MTEKLNQVDSNKFNKLVSVYFLVAFLVSFYLAFTLAGWQGSARAQGEFIFILPFVISVLISLGILILAFISHQNKKYIPEVILSPLIFFFYLPIILEDLIRYFRGEGGRFILRLLLTIIILTIIFYRPFRDYLKSR